MKLRQIAFAAAGRARCVPRLTGFIGEGRGRERVRGRERRATGEGRSRRGRGWERRRGEELCWSSGLVSLLGWLLGTAVERWSSTGELSLSYARPAADG